MTCVRTCFALENNASESKHLRSVLRLDFIDILQLLDGVGLYDFFLILTFVKLKVVKIKTTSKPKTLAEVGT